MSGVEQQQLIKKIDKLSESMSELKVSVATLQATVSGKIAAQDRDIKQLKAAVDKMPAKALGVGSLLIGILLGIGKLLGVKV